MTESKYQINMTENLYFEYRKWCFFWGLTLDQKEEVQSVINEFNAKGWKVRDFEWSGFPKLSFFKMLKVIIITTITLGFCSYWVGFCVIFESTLNNSTTDINAQLPQTDIKTESLNADSELDILAKLKSLNVITESEYSEKVESLEINKTLSENLNKITDLLKTAKAKGVITETEYIDKVNKVLLEEKAKIKEWLSRKPTINDIPAEIVNELPEHLKVQLIQKLEELSNYYFACKFVLVLSNKKLKFIETERWDSLENNGQTSNDKLLFKK